MNSLQRLFEDAEYFCLKLRILLSATFLRNNMISPRKEQICLAGLWSRSRSRRLGLETYQRLVSVSGGRRLGLGHLRLVPKTNFRPNCAGRST